MIFPYLGHAIGLGTEGFAVFAGTAVNDTSSVTAAASTAEGIYGVQGILSAAVTVKLTRTLAIIPITLILFFIAAALITTVIGVLPESGFTAFYSGSFVTAMKWLAKFFIAMAMCAIGLNTNLIDLVKKGGKPIAAGFACWVMISVVSILVQLATGIFYTNI